MIGFDGGGRGPGGVLPQSLGDGNLLVGGVAGDWHAGQNLPPAGGVGSIPFWDGGVPGRYRYSAAPADGDILVFDSGTGLWVPAPPDVAAPTIAFGAITVTAGSGTPYAIPYNGTATTSILNAGQIPITRPTATLRRMFVSHGNPSGASNIVYTVYLNGVATTLAVTLSSGVTIGSNVANSVAVVAGDFISLHCDNSGISLGIRMIASIEVIG